MKLIFIVFSILWPIQLLAENARIHIYQDADLTHHRESSEAIQTGIKVAFDEIGNEIDGYEIVYKFLDHRGNVVRSKRNYQTFIEDPNALVIYSGIHSPPLIKNRTFINHSKALTLVPWAAGGPITRHPSKNNWIFRLSIDDTQAASVIIDFALNEQHCTAPHLLIEQTLWGDSNLNSMSRELEQNGLSKIWVSRFSFNLGVVGARKLLREIADAGSDCIVLVGNAVEGAVIVKEIAELPAAKRLPIVSHWGITGGNFHENVTAQDRAKLDLHFIQSCFAFTSPAQSPLAIRVFDHLTRMTDDAISQPSDLKSAVGFIHAYDLTKILIQAIKQAGLSGNRETDQVAIRRELENINQSVQGLIKNYHTPFSVFDTIENVNAHEALHNEDYCLGRFGSDDEVLILNKSHSSASEMYSR